MKLLDKRTLLYLIIFLEGYAVLATELLAVRGLVPFVGSGVEVVSIIIGAVLMPLAVGYWSGGKRARKEFEKAKREGRRSSSPRGILQNNLLLALMILVIGLSYITQSIFFQCLQIFGIQDRILKTALYSLVFLVVPTYLLAQTVPLVSHYFSKAKLSEITGRMLFYSTLGSFFGSIISTLVFMTVLGVHNTVIITLLVLVFLIIIVSPKGGGYISGLAVFFGFVAWCLNNGGIMREMHFVADTPYSLISIEEAAEHDGLVLSINRSASSKYSVDPEKRYPYLKYIEANFIRPLMKNEQAAPKKILVLGAGGFIIGWEDRKNDYTFVDIDKALKEVSEEHLLPEKLSKNKKFIATSARAFLHGQKEKFDMVFIDVYSNVMSMPTETVTREFLEEVKKVVNPDGIVVSNVISGAAYGSRFSVRYYNTFASVFPVFDRHVIDAFDGWKKDVQMRNTLYIYYNKEGIEDRTIYTDNKNTHSFDN